MTRANSLFGASARLSPSSAAPAKNREGYPAWERSVEERYLQTLLTNTFGNTFYVSQKDMLKEAEAIHTEMLSKNPAFAASSSRKARPSDDNSYCRCSSGATVSATWAAGVATPSVSSVRAMNRGMASAGSTGGRAWRFRAVSRARA